MRQFSYVVAILFTFLTLGSTQILMGQNKLTLDPGGDLVSRYIWRGTDFGNSPAIQPSLDMEVGGFGLGAWGSFSTNDANFQEIDLYASYTIKELVTLTITDYFFPDGRAENNDYLNYEGDSTGHVLEGMVKFNGTEKVPLYVFVATNFAGADAKKANGNLQYSTYIEAGYSLKVKKTNLDFFIGGTPNNPDTENGETGFYGTGPGIINIGLTATREIPITDKFALPIFTSLMVNPQQENIYFVFGISL